MSDFKIFEQNINDNKGKPNNYPGCLNYSIDGQHAIIELHKGFSKKEFRRFDSWGLAFISEAEDEFKIQINQITFKINHSIDDYKYDFESFRRRVSFLNTNNERISCEIIINDENIELYDKESLFNRPEYEIIRPYVNDRNSDDKSGRLEKDFQKFLYGDGLDNRTNDRFAILGDDFYKSKGKDYYVLREFPTGVFKEKINNDCRIMPTEYVDMVTINKHGNLSVIELKLDDEQLEVISQVLDYALFFKCYIDKINKLDEIQNKLTPNIRDKEIFCYVVNNHFHPRFDRILKYYSTKDKDYGFQLIKIVLGYTSEF